MRYRESGFTVTELIIVVAVCALAAAIIVPTLVQRRNVTNEATAMGVLRTVATAQLALQEPGIQYATHGRVIDMDEVVLAEEPDRAGFVGPGFSVAKRRGYRIEVKVLPGEAVAKAGYSGAISPRKTDALIFAKYNVDNVGTVELAPKAPAKPVVLELLPE